MSLGTTPLATLIVVP